MSGGVDSSVAARLLLDQGYNIQPVFMRNWDTLDEQSDSGGCEWEKDFELVNSVCKQALGGIKPRLIDLSRQYWTDVFETALESWRQGLTPNPDVTCNQHIKFHQLPAKLVEIDSQAWLATGHYARLQPCPVDASSPGLFRARHFPKDQSYYLSRAPASALQRSMFPLGDMTKDQVRDLARRWNMTTAERKESMGICFIGERNNFSTWLDSYLAPNPGDIVDEQGRILGRHQGLWRYTIGEGARLAGLPQRLFVAHKDVSSNTIMVVPKDSPNLRCIRLSTDDLLWSYIGHPPPEVDTEQGYRCLAQTRSLQYGALSPCSVRRIGDGSFIIRLDDALTGVAPGQAVVLYDEEWCVGGGTIRSTRTLADKHGPGVA
ncbi:hypothetical protein OIO90_000213 [Microbotryomycetes sp. JL221]|nr:hypothetical protein OIO90_000213 [Microbotryomycetes sp. JL221]